MTRSNQSEKTKKLYKSLSRAAFGCSATECHGFDFKLESFAGVPDEVTMEGDSFPYIRAALIHEAVKRGDIVSKEENRVRFAEDATVTIDGESHPVEDMNIRQ